MSPLAAQLEEVFEVDPEDFPRIAVNALQTLAYRPSLYDRHDNKLIFVDPHDETYGSESWHCLYQATLTWDESADGVLLRVRVKEKNYGDGHIDECAKRAESILRQIRKTILRAADLGPKDPPWKAKFARKADLVKGGYILDSNGPENATDQNQSTAFLLGGFQGQKVRASDRLAHRHVLVCGPTGSGKSTAIFIPNLIERLGTSAVITEAVSGNTPPVLYRATAGWRHKGGHQIIYFNPGDSRTMRINPVDLVKTFDDAQHLAGLIVSNTTAETHMGDQIWAQAETHLLQSLLLHVAGLRQDLNKPSQKGDGANIGYLRRLLRLGPEGLEDELATSRLDMARIEYGAYLNNSSPNFRYGVISGLMARLNLFVNAKIAAVTEVTDFSIDDLKKTLFTAYLATPIHRPDYGPLAALILSFILSLVLKDMDKFKHPLTLYLDEFTNYGYLPGFTRYLTVIRNAGIGAALGIQDPVQLEKVYRDKDAKIIFSQPRTKIFFAPADDYLANRISKMLGMTTDREVVSATGQLSNKETPRPLMDVNDIMNLEKSDEYLVLSQIDPLRLNKLNSWEMYPDELEFDPPTIPILEVDEDLERAEREDEKPPSWAEVANEETERFKKEKKKRAKPRPATDQGYAPPRSKPKKKTQIEESDETKKSYWEQLAEDIE